MKSRKRILVLLGSVAAIVMICLGSVCLAYNLRPKTTDSDTPNIEEPKNDEKTTRPRKNPTIGTGEESEEKTEIEPYEFSSVKQESAGNPKDVEQGIRQEGNYTAAEVFPYLQVTGRTVLTGAGICLDWSNASFTMTGKFNGEVKIRMRFTGISSQTYGYLYVYVDGDENSPRIIKAENGMSWYTLANLNDGNHSLRVVKINEAQFGVMDITEFQFNGTLEKSKNTGRLQMEFIGDSITCGADMIESAVNTVDAENGQKNYGTLTAKALNADASFISASGYRLSYCDDGNKKMVLPNLYEKVSGIRENANLGTNGQWDFASHKMDIVVINLGTNDQVLVDKGRGNELKAAAVSFLKTVREKNPDALIVWCYGAMTDVGAEELKAAVAEFGDADIYFLMVTQNNSGLADHPNAAGHQVIAQELTAFLKDKLSERGR